MGRVEQGSPWGVSGKESPAKAGDPGLIPGWGRSPGEGNGNPLHILAWEITRTEEPGQLQSMRLQSQAWLSDWTHTHDHKQASHRKIMSATKSWALWSSLREEINALGRLIFNKRRVLHQGRADRICFPVTSPFNGSGTWWTWENTATSYMDDIHSLVSHSSRVAYLKVEKDLEGNWIITDKALNG